VQEGKPMDDKKRLEEIKKADYDLLDNVEKFQSDYSWLIEQAEKVEELTKGIQEVKKYMDENSGSPDNPRRLTMNETFEVFMKLTRLL
jgi:hypothetical protein